MAHSGLANVRETKGVLEEFGLYTKHRLGQNFLVDKNIIDSIVDGAEITEDELVIDIGLGIGVITAEAAQRAGKVISGEELVIKAIQSGKAKLVFLANDAGDNLTKKTTDKSHYYKVEVSTVFNTLELSAALGKPRKVVAIADAGFSKKMRTLMN